MTMFPTIKPLDERSKKQAWGHPLARIAMILSFPSWRDGQAYLDEDDIKAIYEQVTVLRDILTATD